MRKIPLNLQKAGTPKLSYAMVPDITDDREPTIVYYVKSEGGQTLEYGLEFKLGKKQFSIFDLQQIENLTAEEKDGLLGISERVAQVIFRGLAKERIRHDRILQLSANRVRHAEAIKEIDDELKNLLKDDIARSEY